MHEARPIEVEKPAPAAPDPPVAVVDIGSNTVRLVVYDGYRRAAGADVQRERRMRARRRAREHRRDRRRGRRTRPRRDRPVRDGWPAGWGWNSPPSSPPRRVREATNGAAFVREVGRRCGELVTVLSGDEEARLSALGVVSGMPRADGIMGDLGGGSLELVDIRRGKIVRQATLPLGILALCGARPVGTQGGARGNPFRARHHPLAPRRRPQFLPRRRGLARGRPAPHGTRQPSAPHHRRLPDSGPGSAGSRRPDGGVEPRLRWNRFRACRGGGATACRSPST